MSALPIREIGLFVLLGFAIYLLLAFASYSPMDPAWTSAGTERAVANLVGSSGALVADAALLTLGWAAYLLPLALVCAAIGLLRPPGRGAGLWPLAAVRCIGFLTAVAAVCVLARLRGGGQNLPAGAGGAIGDAVVAAGLPTLGWAGTTLAAVAALCIGSQATLGYSWLTVAEHAGRGVHAFAQAAINGASRASSRLRRARPKWLDRRDQAAPPPVALSPVVHPGAGADANSEEVGSRADTSAADTCADAGQGTTVDEANASVRPISLPDKGTASSSPGSGASAAVVAGEHRGGDSTPDAPPSPAPAAGTTPAAKAPAPASPDSGAPRPVAVLPGLPGLDLLEEYDADASGGYSRESLAEIAQLLELKLADFRVEAKVVSVTPGPVVTRFELQPAAGVKVSKFTALAKDLARSLAVVSVRIVEIIPGKSVVGIEIPNERRETVRLKEILDSRQYHAASSPLTLALGKDIAGVPVMADIGKMPHLLVAGTTGSGKSVGINAMLLSMLYKAQPDELRLILVDPKMLELAVYDGIPHLLAPVVTDMKDAAQALNWCVAEMERRYQLMAGLGVRNLAGFNRRIADAEKAGTALADPLWPETAAEPAPALARLPYIVVVIDEFADMMMIVGKKVEQLIARIAQKARAAGIHLLLATQRPSVDVITGLIKANIPARMAFQVSSKIDSRTILDQGGAEQLLGHGDMLFLPPGTSMPVRVHGAFVSDEEVHAVAGDWKARGEPDYVPDLLAGAPPDLEVPGTVDLGDDAESEEPLYDEAVAFVLSSRRASISAVQRQLRIGYNRAARLIEAMEKAGVVSSMNANGGREVLAPAPPGTE